MRKPYPSDLTDEQWEIVRPLIPVSRVGRPPEVDMREVLNAIFYLDRAGCPWDMLPHDFPPKSTVYDYFAPWRDDGTWQEIMDALRQKVRVAAGKEPSPPAPGALTARRSRPPRSPTAGATTAARRSPDGSTISSWTRWGCCWSSWCRWRRPMTGRSPPRCWPV